MEYEKENIRMLLSLLESARAPMPDIITKECKILYDYLLITSTICGTFVLTVSICLFFAMKDDGNELPLKLTFEAPVE